MARSARPHGSPRWRPHGRCDAINSCRASHSALFRPPAARSHSKQQQERHVPLVKKKKKKKDAQALLALHRSPSRSDPRAPMPATRIN